MKIRKFGKYGLWLGLTVFSASIVTIGSVGLNVSREWEPFLNQALHASSTKIVDTEGDTQDNVYYKSDYKTLDEYYKHVTEISKQVEAEGVVLMKNDGILPLKKSSKVSCFSRSSVDIVYGGTGSGGTDTSTASNLKDALQAGDNLAVNPTLWDFYYQYKDNKRVEGSFLTSVKNYIREIDPSTFTSSVKSSYSSYGDAAIVVISRVGGEGNDLQQDAFEDGTKYLKLQPTEKLMMDEVAANFSKIIVLVNSANPVELDWLDEYHVNAALQIGDVGQNGLSAVSDILVGKINPSGKLVDTYAADSFSAPAIQNSGDFTFKNGADIDATAASFNKGYDTKYLMEKEGIYIGYKYYETRYEDCVLNQGNAVSAKGVYASGSKWEYSKEVDFPFGYGLSYTTFSQTLTGVSFKDDQITVKAKVKNTGSVAGKDIVQVYSQTPYTQYDIDNKVEKASVNLIGFEKTSQLNPNQEEEITVNIDRYHLTSYDYTNLKKYFLDQGDYYLSLGNGSHDALNNILAKKGKTTADGMDVNGDADKTYKWTLNEKDVNSYTYSKNTSRKVTNQFDDTDINYYGGEKITYLSRNDWNGTWPTKAVDYVASKSLIDAFKEEYTTPSQTTEEEIVTGNTDTKLNIAMMIGASFDDTNWQTLLNQMTPEDMAALSLKACKEEVTVVGKPFNYLKDGPTGITNSFYYNNPTGLRTADEKATTTPTMAYPSVTVMAATFNKPLLKEVGKCFGEDGLWCGVTHHYAPAANIHRTPYSGRNFEYYSEDPILSSYMASKVLDGMNSKGSIPYIKHFAMNDQETNRTGVATFANEQAVRELYLKAFEEPIKTYGKAIMGGFNRIGTRWTGANSNLMTNVLVDEWGYNGIVDTDFALFSFMEPLTGLNSGTTDFAITNVSKAEIVLAKIPSDKSMLKKLRDACHRNLYVIANSNEMNGISKTATLVRVTPWYQKVLIGTISVSSVLLVCSGAMLVLHVYPLKKEEK